MPTDAQRRNLASAYATEIKKLNERIKHLEARLFEMQNAAIDLAKQVRQEHEPGPVNLWDGTPAKYGIAPADKGNT